MTIVSFIVLLVIAAIAGSIGQALAGYSLGGCLVSTVVGFIGAFLGIWLARQFGLPEFYTISVGGETFPVDHWLFYLCPDGGFANERQKDEGVMPLSLPSLTCGRAIMSQPVKLPVTFSCGQKLTGGIMRLSRRRKEWESNCVNPT